LNGLVWEANDLLDKLNEVCGVIARQRKAGKISPAKKAAEAADARKAQKALPDVVPYDASVKFITGEKYRKVKRAKEKFETVVFGNARELGSFCRPYLPLE
jgi:hypothetical protein